MKRLQKTFVIIFLGLFLFNPVSVLAQSESKTNFDVPEYKGVDESLTSFLCTPSDPPTGNDLENCINKGYRFGIAFGAIALVFFLVFAGYMYMTGGETGKEKGKSIFRNALVGMGILLSSYLILSFINPNLVIFKPIQPPIFTAPDLPSCEAVGLGQECVLPNGEIASSNGSGGGTKYATCPEKDLVQINGISTDGSVGPICATLLEKLVALKASTSGISWLVTSTVDGKHLSQCHKPGTSVSGVCADIAMNGGRLPSYTKEAGSTNPKWGELCAAISKLGGITIANEASKSNKCPGYKAYSTTTGPNLHIFLSK